MEKKFQTKENHHLLSLSLTRSSSCQDKMFVTNNPFRPFHLFWWKKSCFYKKNWLQIFFLNSLNLTISSINSNTHTTIQREKYIFRTKSMFNVVSNKHEQKNEKVFASCFVLPFFRPNVHLCVCVFVFWTFDSYEYEDGTSWKYINFFWKKS